MIHFLHVVLRTCTVTVKDIRDIEHSVEVTAETLYEAIATALAALQKDNWVGRDWPGIYHCDCDCPATAGEARSQNEGLCLLARAPRAISSRGHPEAKAGENIGQGKPSEDVIKGLTKSGRTDLSSPTDSESERPCWSA
jgi:hypothetical protein